MDWSRLEAYIRAQGLQDVMEFDRLNAAEQPMMRLAAMAKKIDFMCKRDPEFAKFAAANNLFSALQSLVLYLHKNGQGAPAKKG